MRATSTIAPGWWDYTTLDPQLLADAARLSSDDLIGLAREGFAVRIYETREDFFLAEALEYITAWQQATPNAPAGICGPIGPTEQLPLVARLVNELNLDLHHAHFWGMDEWVVEGKPAREILRLDLPRPISISVSSASGPSSHARREFTLSQRRHRRLQRQLRLRALRCDARGSRRSETLGLQRPAAPRRFLGRRSSAAARIPQAGNAHRRFAPHDDHSKCSHVRRRRGVGRACPGNHRRASGNLEGGKSVDLASRLARQSVRPAPHDADDFPALADSAVPMSLLADHPQVQFNFLRSGIGTCEIDMH